MNERRSQSPANTRRRLGRPSPADYLEYETIDAPDAIDSLGSGPARLSDWAEPAAEPRGPSRYARGLGWLGIGSGLVSLLAPGHVAGLLGPFDTRNSRWALRLIGARQLLTGAAIVTRRRPNAWLWSRVVGGAIDIGLLLGTRGMGKGLLARSSRRHRPLALAALGAVTAIDLVTSYRATRGNGAARGNYRSQARVTERDSGTHPSSAVPFHAAVTINRPPAVIYAFWRHLENLPRFMTYLDSVEIVDQRRSHWKARGAGAVVAWDADIVEDVPNHRIAWQSSSTTKGLKHSGRVRFAAAPGNRGTEVRLELSVALPGDTVAGPLAGKVARLLRKVPEQVALNDLRRLKQIIETGSLARSDASIHAGPHPARPSSPVTTAAGPNTTTEERS